METFNDPTFFVKASLWNFESREKSLNNENAGFAERTCS